MDDTTRFFTPSGGDAIFTPNETKLICAIMQNLTSEIQFDVDKVALDLGYKNAGSLRARWNSLKRSKISTTDAAPVGGVGKATLSKKAKAMPKKAKAAGGEDDDESPTKKSVKGGKAKPKVKTEEGAEEVVESVEGPKGIALCGDTVLES
ncbi:hypothetical protein MBLNU13_g05518t1 [Cladosporium sp. NU13]